MGKANGWLVYSGVYSEKSLIGDMIRRQREALEKMGIDFDFVDLVECASRVNEIMRGEREVPAWALYRAADMEMKLSLEMLGVEVMNSYEVAKICQDKLLTAVFASKVGVAHPNTIRVPNMAKFADKKDEFMDAAEKAIGYPMLVKDAQGESGRGLFIAHDREELAAALEDKSPMQIIQQLVETSWGRDARMFVIDGKVEFAITRVNDTGDFRSSTDVGGRISRYEPTDEEIAFAEKIGKHIPRSAVSVDIMWDGDGHPIMCEMNGNPNFGSFKEGGVLYNAPIADKISEMISRVDAETRK